MLLGRKATTKQTTLPKKKKKKKIHILLCSLYISAGDPRRPCGIHSIISTYSPQVYCIHTAIKTASPSKAFLLHYFQSTSYPFMSFGYPCILSKASYLRIAVPTRSTTSPQSFATFILYACSKSSTLCSVHSIIHGQFFQF